MSSVEEASPSRSRSSTSLDDESVVLHEKYMLVDGDYYPRWSSGDTTFDYEETTLAPADRRRVPSQTAVTDDYVLELLWNSRRYRGPREKIQKGPTIEIESAEYRTFGTWGHSPGQLSSLVRSVAVAKRNRRVLRQWKLRRYDERNYNRAYYDSSFMDCAGKLLLELGSRIQGRLASIALALDHDDLDRGELREASNRPTLFHAATLRIENGSATRRRYYRNNKVSLKMDSDVLWPKRSKPLSTKRSTQVDPYSMCSSSFVRKFRKPIPT